MNSPIDSLHKELVLGGKGLTTTAGLSGLGIGKLKPATN